MNIDFHYGIVYITTRLAGMSRDQAEIVAHACQYVDDSTVPGILKFAGGESYERFASAHKMLDYKNAINDEDRVVWAPFHFLPGGQGDSLEDKTICRPDSEISREMVRRALESKNEDNGLHRLGVTLHAYVDTWAHQGFSGTISEHNVVTYLVGDDHTQQTWLDKIKAQVTKTEQSILTNFLDHFSKLGHGAALHFPDMPWAKWNYTNGHGKHIERDNLPDFIQAANMSCKVVQAWQNNNKIFENEVGLSIESKEALKSLLGGNRDHDELRRFDVVCNAIETGKIPGIKESMPVYVARGKVHGNMRPLALLMIELTATLNLFGQKDLKIQIIVNSMMQLSSTDIP